MEERITFGLELSRADELVIWVWSGAYGDHEPCIEVFVEVNGSTYRLPTSKEYADNLQYIVDRIKQGIEMLEAQALAKSKPVQAIDTRDPDDIVEHDERFDQQ